MDENWKNIDGFESKYQISDMGRVKSLNYNHTEKEEILKPGYYDKSKKYLFVTLCKNGKRYNKKMHQLVAEAFVPNPDNKPCIDHIDGNPSNNTKENLRWCTHKENNNNPITRKRNSEARYKKPVVCLRDNQIIKIYDAIQYVEKDGFKIGNVWKCCQGKRKHHHGFQFHYATEEDVN